jgi:2,4-diaminopentanoate dehydrogenase
MWSPRRSSSRATSWAISAGLSDRVDRVSITESFDTSIYNSPATEIPMGFGHPIDRPDLHAITEKGSGIFREAVALIAETTEDLQLPGDWIIRKGCVAGVDVRWKGLVGDRDVIEVRGQWRKGQSLDPDWAMDFGYTVEVTGRPTIRPTLGFLPPPDFQGQTIDDFVMLGLTITAMPAITAIPVAAAARHEWAHQPVIEFDPGPVVPSL